MNINIIEKGPEKKWNDMAPKPLLTWCAGTSLRRLQTNNMEVKLTTDKKDSLVMRSFQQFEMKEGQKIKNGWYIEWDDYCHYVRHEAFYQNDQLLFMCKREIICTPYIKEMLIFDVNNAQLLYEVQYKSRKGIEVKNLTTGVVILYKLDWIEDHPIYKEMMAHAPQPFWTKDILLKPFIELCKTLSL